MLFFFPFLNTKLPTSPLICLPSNFPIVSYLIINNLTPSSEYHKNYKEMITSYLSNDCAMSPPFFTQKADSRRTHCGLTADSSIFPVYDINLLSYPYIAIQIIDLILN